MKILQVKMLLLLMGIALFIGACKDAQMNSTQSVEWFKTHPMERDAQLAECSSNPEKLATTVSCIHATEAETIDTRSVRKRTEAAPLKSGDSNQR